MKSLEPPPPRPPVLPPPPPPPGMELEVDPRPSEPSVADADGELERVLRDAVLTREELPPDAERAERRLPLPLLPAEDARLSPPDPKPEPPPAAPEAAPEVLASAVPAEATEEPDPELEPVREPPEELPPPLLEPPETETTAIPPRPDI